MAAEHALPVDARSLRDRLEALQREVKALRQERDQIESPAFVAARAKLVGTTEHLQREAEVLELQQDTMEQARMSLTTEVTQLELELRANEQRSLSSLVLLGALATAGAVAYLWHRDVTAETVTGTAGLMFGWLLLGRWVRLSPKIAPAVVGVWVGSVAALVGAWLTLHLAYGRDGGPMLTGAFPWGQLLSPSGLLLISALTAWVGESHKRGVLISFLATLAAPLSMAQPFRQIFVNDWYDQSEVMALATGCLAPVFFLVFLVARRLDPSTRGAAIGKGGLAMAAIALATFCIVRAPSVVGPRWAFCSSHPWLAVAIEASVAAGLIALSIASRWRWLALSGAVTAVGWAAATAQVLPR